MQFKSIISLFLLAMAGVEAGVTGPEPPTPIPTNQPAPVRLRVRNPFEKREPEPVPAALPVAEVVNI
jgi:hypothetical protein